VQAKIATFYACDPVQIIVAVLIFRFFKRVCNLFFLLLSAAADSAIFVSSNFLANTAQAGL